MNAGLHIDRLTGAYEVPRALPDPVAARRRLDGVMSGRLPAACGRFLAPVLERDDPSVWLVRRLEVELAVDLGAADDETLSRVWAGRIAARLGRILAAGPDGENVLRFDDRGAYLACFARDLAGGRAWGSWLYGPFESLRSLGTGGAVREALVREPEWIVPVLVRLAEGGGLAAVLGVLGEGDAGRILAAAPTAAGGGAGERRTVQALAAVWRLAAEVVRGRSRAHAALGLFACATARFPDLAAAGCPLASIDRVLDLAALLARLGDPAAVLDRLAAGDLTAAVAEARRAGAAAEAAVLPVFARLADGDGAWLREIGRALAPSAAGSVEVAGPGEAFVSPFAAVFFLLPSALALGLDEMVGESALLRHRVLARCFGGLRAAAAGDDPALFAASGLDPAELAKASAALDEDAGRGVADRLRGILARERRVDGRCLAAELVCRGWTPSVRPGCAEPYPGLRGSRIPNPKARGSAPRDVGREVLLLRDTEHDFWLVAEPVSEGEKTVRRLLAALQEVRQRVEVPVEHLLLGPELGRRLAVSGVPGELPGRLLWREPTGGEAPAPVAGLEGLWAADPQPLDGEAASQIQRFLSRARPAAEELEYLWGRAPARPGNPHPDPLDLAVALAARAVLRHFAGRLMGFGWSRSEFLHRNFLAGEGTVRRTAEGLEVTLPRMPLHLVARMAGADGMSYTVPWLETRITLALPEA